jgi:hypothetical protein
LRKAALERLVATNWVALTSGFAIALAAGLAAQGQGKVPAAACEALGRNPAARARNSGGADSRTRFYRVAGAVHAGDYFREGSVRKNLCR